MGRSVLPILGAVAGGTIGFFSGGPMGAAAGAALGGGTGVSVMGAMGSASAIEAQAELAANQRKVNAVAAEQQAMILERTAAAAEYEATLAGLAGQINQSQAEITANQIKDRTGATVLQVRREVEQIGGAQVVGAFRRNIELEGTPALALQESASRAEDDVASILQAGRFDEMTARTQGELYRLDSNLQSQRARLEALDTRTAADQARRSGKVQQIMIPYEQSMGAAGAWASRLQGYSTLLTNAGRLASMFYKPSGSSKSSGWMSGYSDERAYY